MLALRIALDHILKAREVLHLRSLVNLELAIHDHSPHYHHFSSSNCQDTFASRGSYQIIPACLTSVSYEKLHESTHLSCLSAFYKAFTSQAHRHLASLAPSHP